MIDYLVDYMPVVSDIIRTTKYSYKLGQIIGKFLSQQDDSESDFTVVWRRTDVFLKQEKEGGNEISENLFLFLLSPPLVGMMIGWFFHVLSDGAVPVMAVVLLCTALGLPTLISKVLIPYLQLRDIKKSSEIELTNNPYKLIRSKKGKMGICYWEMYGSAKLLLKPRYDNIDLGFNCTYVVKYKDKYMLYNAILKMFVADNCDNIIRYKEGLYLFIKGDEVSLMTPAGDRVYE